MELKITTFNVENLFNRYAFLNDPWNEKNYERFVQAVDVVSIASRAGDLVAETTTTIQRNNTAMAIEEVAPDILAVQEIENIYTLRNFNNSFLSDYFENMISLDGNDPRAIDVGLLVNRGKAKNIEILGFRTHIDEPEASKQVVRREYRPNFGYFVQNNVFSRDCLEVDLRIKGKVITLLINHFKAQDGTAASTKRRALQAKYVRKYAELAAQDGKLPIVIGDLNIDTKQKGYDNSLDPLLKSTAIKDPFKAGPDLWTHFYSHDKSVSRLDYILVSPKLKVTATDIFRKGLSTKCKQYAGTRFSTIGPEHTEASDHCPTSIVIEV